MIDKLSIILLGFNPDDISNALNNIDKQTFKNLEVFILTLNEININANMESSKYHVITLNDKSSFFQNLISLSVTLPGNFITFMNASDTNEPIRFKTQIQFMNSNNYNLCSCREMTLNYNSKQNRDLDESNRFTDADDINAAISAAYLPLDLYTFMYKKSFLEDINSYSSNINFESEIDLILYFLRYEKIYKIPQVLYYVKNPRIPYKECSFYYDSPNSNNKLAIFNRAHVLENQSYFRELINSKKVKIDKDKKYKYAILVIIDGVYLGGTETYIVSLANRLKKENIELCVFTKKCVIKEWFTFYNIPLHIFDINNVIELRNNIASINHIRLIQLHTPGDIALSQTLKSIVNVPITFTIHGIYYNEDLIRSYIKYIDNIVFVSKYVGDFYMRLLSEQSYTNYEVIQNGVDTATNSNELPQKINLRQSLGIPEDSIIILYCSRLSFNKATLAMHFLKTFDILSKKYSNIYSVVIGDGMSAFTIKNAYKNNSGNTNLITTNVSLVDNNKNNNMRIFFLGSRFNMPSYYLESDIVVGTGRVAIEAMSIGTPVISFGSNCDVNIVEASTINTLIDSNFGDHYSIWAPLDEASIINKLNDYMELLINSKEKRTEIGNWSKSYVENHLNLERITNFYKKICENDK